MSAYRWVLLGDGFLGFIFVVVGTLLIPFLVGKILDVSGSFPAAFTACAAFQALAFVGAVFTPETGMHKRPVMVT